MKTCPNCAQRNHQTAKQCSACGQRHSLSKAGKQRAAKVRTGLDLMIAAMFAGLATAAGMFFVPALSAVWIILAIGIGIAGFTGKVICLNAPKQAGRKLLKASIVVDIVMFTLLAVQVVLFLTVRAQMAGSFSTEALEAVRQKIFAMQVITFVNLGVSLISWVLQVLFLRKLAVAMKRHRLAKFASYLLRIAAVMIAFPLIVVLAKIVFPSLPYVVAVGTLWLMVALALGLIVMQASVLIGLRNRLARA